MPSHAADRVRDRRKIRDRSSILVMVGVILLMPPAVGVFDLPVGIGGIPLALIYLFGVWAALIAGAALLAGRLLDAELPPDKPEPPAPAD